MSVLIFAPLVAREAGVADVGNVIWLVATVSMSVAHDMGTTSEPHHDQEEHAPEQKIEIGWHRDTPVPFGNIIDKFSTR